MLVVTSTFDQINRASRPTLFVRLSTNVSLGVSLYLKICTVLLYMFMVRCSREGLVVIPVFQGNPSSVS